MPPCRARRNPTGGEVQNSPGTLRTSLHLVISASPGRGWVGRSAPPRQARISKKLPAYHGGHPIYTPLARRAPSTARFPLDARLRRSSPDDAATLVSPTSWPLTILVVVPLWQHENPVRSTSEVFSPQLRGVKTLSKATPYFVPFKNPLGAPNASQTDFDTLLAKIRR